MNQPPAILPSLYSTGIQGLDSVLAGGLASERLYLLEGEPGTGKTTCGLQFLLEGVRQGQSALYITLSETADELHAMALSHGWNLAPIHIEEIIPDEDILDPGQQYTLFHPSEIELGLTTQRILTAIERYQPTRLVLDSLAEFQLLAENSLRYRRHVLALKQYLARRACTAIFIDDRSSASHDLQVRSVAHGVIALEWRERACGIERRRLRVIKYRATAFRGGAHDYKIVRGGLLVYPRLSAADTPQEGPRGQLSSGLAALDTVSGGGLEQGMSTLIAGPPGSAKSVLATQFVAAAAARGQACAIFLFQQARQHLLQRADELNLSLRPALESGLLTIEQIDPAERTPGELIHLVVQAALRGARLIVIDSVNACLEGKPDEFCSGSDLQELLSYLGQSGVATVLVGEQQNMLDSAVTAATGYRAGYRVDNLIVLSYFEAEGAVQQAMTIFKQGGNPLQRTICRLEISARGIEIGPAPTGLQGILTGAPRHEPHPVP